MIYGSVCSGIEAATVAWHPLGWRPSFFSEIEAFPRAVLSHRFPDVPLHGDFTTIEAGQYEPIDLLVGGTPCQDFSIAGLRAGMAGDRGNLTLQFLALADRLRPRWLVWENVPGVLSSNGGRDFGSFLGGLAELGYQWAYRTLDAQHFGLAQRRRRVFVVGYFGDWQYPAAVLFERASLSGHPAPRREAGQSVARPIAAGVAGSSGYRNDADTAENLIARCVTARNTRIDAETETLVAHAFDARQSDVVQYGDRTGALHTHGHSIAVAFHENQRGELTVNDTVGAIKCAGGKPGQGYPAVAFQASQSGMRLGEGTHPTLDSNNGSRRHHGALIGAAVRRLTPRECERLQGFPDNWTLVPYRGKPAADGPRYRAIGNSMAVPCMAWIGRRIQAVEDMIRNNEMKDAS